MPAALFQGPSGPDPLPSLQRAHSKWWLKLELGRMGETDALFTAFVSGSLLIWHWCYVRGAPARLTWCLGYLFAALGTLTKGPQAPVYFAGVVAAYLIWTRQWRFAFTRAHA